MSPRGRRKANMKSLQWMFVHKRVMTKHLTHFVPFLPKFVWSLPFSEPCFKHYISSSAVAACDWLHAPPLNGLLYNAQPVIICQRCDTRPHVHRFIFVRTAYFTIICRRMEGLREKLDRKDSRVRLAAYGTNIGLSIRYRSTIARVPPSCMLL